MPCWTKANFPFRRLANHILPTKIRGEEWNTIAPKKGQRGRLPLAPHIPNSLYRRAVITLGIPSVLPLPLHGVKNLGYNYHGVVIFKCLLWKITCKWYIFSFYRSTMTSSEGLQANFREVLYVRRWQLSFSYICLSLSLNFKRLRNEIGLEAESHTYTFSRSHTFTFIWMTLFIN